MTENLHAQETTQVQDTGNTFPATASAEGFGRPVPLPPDTQLNGRPFPATASAEGAQLNAPPSPGDRAATSECRSGMTACGMGHKGLKGLLLMAACCGAPLLLFLALPVLGPALGGTGTAAVNTLAALACPVGMGLMMWLMLRGQQAGADQAAHTQPVALPPVTTTASAGPQEGAPLSWRPSADAVAGAGELPAGGGRYADTSGPAH